MQIGNLAPNLNLYASDSLAERIRSKITSGELPVGYEFPKEEEYCKQLGVSRSTLREACKVLTASGYIRLIKGHGTVVNDLTNVIENAPIGESLKVAEIEDVLEFREMVETTQAKHAAEKATPAQIARLESILEKMKANTDDLQAFSTLDEEYHLLISEMSGNSLLFAIMRHMESVINETIHRAFLIDTKQNVQDAIKAHTEVLDAIKAHDPQTAEKKMREHINSVSARFVKKEQNV
ncbi:MAG: FadR family transcriptional regulator [Spirochaetales bacterium]|nr:FadR family transcriptional regulator [Candidatus Physcosoma equi]